MSRVDELLVAAEQAIGDGSPLLRERVVTTFEEVRDYPERVHDAASRVEKMIELFIGAREAEDAAERFRQVLRS